MILSSSRTLRIDLLEECTDDRYGVGLLPFVPLCSSKSEAGVVFMVVTVVDMVATPRWKGGWIEANRRREIDRNIFTFSILPSLQINTDLGPTSKRSLVEADPTEFNAKLNIVEQGRGAVSGEQDEDRSPLENESLFA